MHSEHDHTNLLREMCRNMKECKAMDKAYKKRHASKQEFDADPSPAQIDVTSEKPLSNLQR